MDHATTLNEFREACAAEGLLGPDFSSDGDDISSGIHDDGTLMRFLRARQYNIANALRQYKATRTWRDTNQLIELYDSIDVENYEETRKLYTHWIGRRARNGSPICLFEIAQLTPDIMSAYNKSCDSTVRGMKTTESEAMLRLFCTYENLIRFVLPLCSAVPSRPNPTIPVTDTTCIVDITGVSLLQFWRLRTHMQAASVLATSHYPETLGRTYIIGAPSFFSTIWGWISQWFDQNTVSKIQIVPTGKELSLLSESIDPVDIPKKYGGQFPFTFGMLPDLDPDIKKAARWWIQSHGKPAEEIPKGPMKWVRASDEGKIAVAVGTVAGQQRKMPVMTLL